MNTTVNTSIVDLNEAIVFYSDDLPNPNTLDEELCLWKTKWLAVKLQDRPETISDTLKQCCPTSLPNIFTLLKLFGTIPLSSAHVKDRHLHSGDLTIICDAHSQKSG